MTWFESKTQKEVLELRAEIAKLRNEIRCSTEIRIEKSPKSPFVWVTLRLKDVVLALAAELNLEIKTAPATPARILIERKGE